MTAAELFTTPVGQVNSALAIMGPTGAGKSSLIATAAEHLQETYGQQMLYYNFSGGGFPAKIQSLVRLGVIRLWRARTREEAFETTMRASMGWWPSRINPSNGETAPGVKLVPPITQRFTMKCPEGHVVKVVPFASLLTPMLCPTCKQHVSQTNMQVEKQQQRTKGFESIGAVAYDDLTSMLQWQMDDMASRHAKKEIQGEETALGGRIQSGDMILGGNNRAHYGFVQSRASEMVHNSLSIPRLSLPPVWTMLMLETVDEGGLPVKGPKLAGKAKTDEAGAWFGNMLEVGVVRDEESGKDVRRLSLNEFIDDGGYRHLIKHRGSPRMPPYLQDAPDAPWSQVHLGVFFTLLAQDIQRDMEEQAARMTETPGVPEGEVEYGEANVVTPGPVAATAPATQAVPTPTIKPGTPGRAKVAPRPRVLPTVTPPKTALDQMAEALINAPIDAGVLPMAPDPLVIQPAPPAPPTPSPAVVAAARPAPVRAMAPPPGARPPAVAPRRPPTAPRPSGPPPLPVEAATTE